MSQQCLFDRYQLSRPMSEREMLVLLRTYFEPDAQPSFLWELSHKLKDPFVEHKAGQFRMHPLWLSLGTLAVLALSVFFYFTFLR